MSLQKINEYYRKVAETIRISGTNKETALRRHFAELLSYYAKKHNLILIDEFPIKNTSRIADGALLTEERFPIGYWEAKDLSDNLEKEINKKIKLGYPTFNIFFENSKTAVLYQDHKPHVIDMHNAHALHHALVQFVSYQTQEARNFKEALTQFAKDVPYIIALLQSVMQQLTQQQEPAFMQKRQEFHELCKVCINPNISLTDIDEMIIQHLLTEDIFKNVFADTQFHEENNIAQALKAIEQTFFVGELKREITYKMKTYYAVIKEHAAQLDTHREKQHFLKYLYETFYKAYSPKNADKLGIVYTPLEVVEFMIKATDYLLEKHFHKTLLDKNVHILDPCTGTGTFICDLLDYLPAHNLDQLTYKYKYEIHANEVAILPYYIAYLNIQYTYQRKTNRFHSFDNLCWVDTLDNAAALQYAGKQANIFTSLAENTKRIQNQNQQRISVIIGNPPYNANQQNENDNNKNREYKEIDKRIKETFIKQSTAQKTKMYDMYARFYRWAMDRIDNNGVIAFVSNRSFIDSKTFDGFRKTVQREFDEIYIIDTKSDVRQNPKIAGTTHNIFGIQTGVAITFLVKKDSPTNQEKNAKIFYYTLTDEMRKEEKLVFLRENELNTIPFERIRPDEQGNWINLSKSDFQNLVPLCNKEGKLGHKGNENTIFELYSLGINTSRDEWSYDFDKKQLESKAKFFIDFFHQEKERWKQADKTQKTNDFVDRTIKWTSELEAHMTKFAELEQELVYLQSLPPNGKREKIQNVKKALQRYLNFKFNRKNIIVSTYRPFVKKYLYFDKFYTHRPAHNIKIFGSRSQFQNKIICFSGTSSYKPFQCFASNILVGLDFLEKTQCVPLYRYAKNGEKIDNITDWALNLFQTHYQDQSINKENIFHYVYAVLHKPEYRAKYALDLKRNLPRIPLYADFWHYATIGKELMNLHLTYDSINADFVAQQLGISVERKARKAVEPKRNTTNADTNTQSETTALKNKLLQTEVKLRLKDKQIEIDEWTTLRPIPDEVYEYKLGNRTAVEWVLEQYKPYKSSDATIQEKFNTYNFYDYKEQVIELLLQVIYVSVQTVKLVRSL